MAVFPLVSPIFQPSLRQIAAITSPGSFEENLILIVTTTQDHLYKNGLFVRLAVPITYGSYQLDQQFGPLIVLSPTSFLMVLVGEGDLQFDPFVIPPAPKQFAQVIPIAEDVTLLNSAVQNVLP